MISHGPGECASDRVSVVPVEQPGGYVGGRRDRGGRAGSATDESVTGGSKWWTVEGCYAVHHYELHNYEVNQ